MALNNIFIPIRKVDAEQRLVYGVLAAETADLSNEILDYEASKVAFQEWSEGIDKVTEGKSKGNLRAMHNPKVAGKFVQVEFNDDAKQVEVCAKVEADDEWKLVETGCYTGFSIGAKAAWRKKDEADPKLTRYAVGKMIEGSLVDLPCIPTATFEYIKGATTEVRKFIVPEGASPVNEFKTQFKSVLPALEKVGSADRLLAFAKQTAQSAGIKKSLWDASDLACCLMTLNSIRMNLKYEESWEGDNSPIPEELRTWIDQGAALLASMVAEEAAEMTADAPNPKPEELLALAAEPEVKKNEEPAVEAPKTDAPVAEPEVEKTPVADAPAAPAAPEATPEVAKVAETDITKKFDEAVNKLNGRIEEQATAFASLADSVKTITEMLTGLRNVPAPMKGVASQAVAVTKAQDNGDVAKVEVPKDSTSAFKMALAPENAHLIA